MDSTVITCKIVKFKIRILLVIKKKNKKTLHPFAPTQETVTKPSRGSVVSAIKYN